MQIACFIHIATLNNYQSIVNDFCERFKKVGLSNKAKIKACVCGSGNLSFPFEIERLSTNIEDGEAITIQYIINYCKLNPESNILYIHVKGVTSPDNECVADWRKYMSYFVINKYDDCLITLNSYDTCGVDLRDDPVKHYSGNFWWARASHILKLPTFSEMPIVLTERHKSEFWLCQHGSHKSLWDCGINQYQRHLFRYEECNYVRNSM